MSGIIFFIFASCEPLKGICKDFENFVNVLWIRSLIHVHLICERNFEIGFIVFEHSSFDFFRPNISLKTIPKKINLWQ